MSNSNHVDDDLVDGLRAYMAAIAHDVDVAVETPMLQPRRRASGRRNIALIAAVAAVAVLVPVLLVVVGNEDGGQLATEDRSSDVPSSEPGIDGSKVAPGPGSGPDGFVSVLPDMPLDFRTDVATAWTGEELVVWGGDLEAANMGVPGEDRQFADGAAFDPVAGEWRSMSPGPLPRSTETPVAVNTGDGVVIARGVSVALWNPSDDSWTALPDAPAAVRDLTWTGSVLVSASANAVLDVGSDGWTTVGQAPVVLERPATAWTGSELVVVGGPSTPFTSAAAIALDPEGREWRTLADPPEDLHAEALAATWDGERVVVVNYDMKSVAYDVSADSWAQLAPVPARFYEWSPMLTSAEGYSVAFMGQAIVVLQPDGRWLPLPYGDVVPGATAIAGERSDATGPIVYSVGFDSTQDRNIVTALDIAKAARAPEALQVGTATVGMPDGFTFADADYESGSSPRRVVRVDLEYDDGTCVLTSTYGVDIGDETDPVIVDETLPETPDLAWRRSQAGTSWVAERDTDTLRIACDTPEAARTLAQSTRL